MPRNRMIKPEFWTSAQVVACSPFARLLFIGLWNFSDDAGIHPANVLEAKMQILPGDILSTDNIKSLINELIANKLIIEYKVNGERYWQVTGWSKHQTIKKPYYKYPSPDQALIEVSNENNEDSSTTSSPPVPNQYGTSSPPVENHSLQEKKRKEKKVNINTNVFTFTSSELQKLSEPAVIMLTLNDKSEYPIIESQIVKWKERYPGIDVLQQLRNMQGWCDANPTRRKTRNGVMKFIENWLAKQQNQSPRQGGKYHETYHKPIESLSERVRREIQKKRENTAFSNGNFLNVSNAH